MSKITRNDVFVRDEKGPEWFNDFLRSFSEQKTSGVLQDILDTITNKKLQTVDGVVKNYREQVGLDILGSADDDDLVSQTLSKEASSIGPISPMKLKKIDNPDDILKDYDNSEIVIQIKLDGFKTQAIMNNGKVGLFTRRGKKFTDNIPELVKELESKMKSDSFILGEIVWEDSKGIQSISDIQTIVGGSAETAAERISVGDGNVVLYAYDLLWDNGKDITKQKYIDRYNKLKSIIGKNAKAIKICDNYSYSEKDTAINDALKAGAEGIVLKPKDSEYKYGTLGSNEPFGEWAKFKPEAKAHTDEVILNKYTKGENKLIFPMYQYKGNDLIEVGKLSGMSKEDESKIKKDIDNGKTVVVEITFQERMESGKFRHVGWSRFRPDKPAKEVKVSKSSFKPLSIRHAETKISIIDIIKNDKELSADIESYCVHSGGTKSTSAIINYIRSQLRKKLGDGVVVRFADEDLKNYIESLKKDRKHSLTDFTKSDVGKAGTEVETSYEDNVADYINHSPK
jgi:hypothetical protein